jgi:predicted P-loop ATPase
VAFQRVANALAIEGGIIIWERTPASFKDPAEWRAASPSMERPVKLTIIDGGGTPDQGSAAPDLGSQEPLSNGYSSICRILRTPPMRRLLMGQDGEFAFNEMTLVPTFDGKDLYDHDLSSIRERAEVRFSMPGKRKGLKFTRQDVSDAVLQVSMERPFHPVRTYLDGLRWDGASRLDAISEAYLGVEATDLSRTMLRRWLISAVARAFQPGCQVDNVLVLVGAQGIRKSSFFRVLASDQWFADSAMSIGDKDSYLKLHSAWVYEWAELEAMQRARDVGTVKAFVTSRTDVLRVPYGRSTRAFPRSCVIVGTTNDVEFLTDTTGNRRYWTVSAPGNIDTDKLAIDRDQLWAEAVFAYRKGEPWYLSDAEGDELSTVHETHAVTDAWEEEVRRFLLRNEGTEITVNLILSECLKKPVERWTRADQMRVGATLTRLGWRKQRVRGSASKRLYRWTPSSAWTGEEELPF